MSPVIILIRFINILFGIIATTLTLRFILKLFGASTQADFVVWMYQTSDSLLYPFIGMFPSPAVDLGNVFEFSTLFAILVYGIFAWLLVEAIEFVEEIIRRQKMYRS